jgi:hypothetical protein
MRTVVVAEYEKITAEIEAELFEQVEGLKPEQVKHGRSNLWAGISGFPHQIDVSVEGEKDVLLAECKCWIQNVDVDRFLTFLARILDIRPTEQGRMIHSAVVTTKGFDSGITKLAGYYGINLHTVTSPTDFVLKYKNLFSISKSDQVSVSEEVLLEVKRADEADKK